MIDVDGATTISDNLMIRNPQQNGALILSPSTSGAGIDAELVVQDAAGGAGGNADFHISRNALFRTSDDTYQYIDDAGDHASQIRFEANGDLVFSWADTGTGAVSWTETLKIDGSTGDVSALSFTPTSDAAAKEAFAPVDGAALLDKVAALPTKKWSFKDDSSGARHIGPTAQDFKAAFGVGGDDEHIATVDADGVALAAIKALRAEKDREIAELRAMVERLHRVLSDGDGHIQSP